MPMTQGRHTSDRSPFEVFAEAPTSAAYQYGRMFSMHYHDAVDVKVKVPTKGSVASVTLKAQVSFDGVEWSDLDDNNEGVTSPVATEATYTVAADDHVEHRRFRKGGPWMRVGALFDDTDGTFELEVLRVVL